MFKRKFQNNAFKFLTINQVNKIVFIPKLYGACSDQEPESTVLSGNQDSILDNSREYEVSNQC